LATTFDSFGRRSGGVWNVEDSKEGIIFLLCHSALDAESTFSVYTNLIFIR